MTDNILIVTAMPVPGHQADMGTYMTGVMPLLMAAGGELITRCKITDKVHGNGGYGMVMIMRFKDAETIQRVFSSDDYNALIEVRGRAFSSIDISIGDDA